MTPDAIMQALGQHLGGMDGCPPLVIPGRGAALPAYPYVTVQVAARADWGLPTYPGSEAAVLLAMARVLLDEGLADLGYLERWTNWDELLEARRPGRPGSCACWRRRVFDRNLRRGRGGREEHGHDRG